MLIEAFSEAFGLILSTDADLYEILWLSIQVSLTALLISIGLGLPIGTTLAIANFPGKTVCITVINSLMGMPPVVVGLLVYLALSRSGPFGVFGLLYTPSAMVIAQVFDYPDYCGTYLPSHGGPAQGIPRPILQSQHPTRKSSRRLPVGCPIFSDNSCPCRLRSSDIRSRRGDDRRREYRSPHTGDDYCNRARNLERRALSRPRVRNRFISPRVGRERISHDCTH